MTSEGASTMSEATSSEGVVGEGVAVETTSTETTPTENTEEQALPQEATDAPPPEETPPEETPPEEEEPPVDDKPKEEEPPKEEPDIKTLQSENKEMKSQLEEIQKVNDRVRSLWEQFPEIPNIISDLHRGAPLSVALAKNIDLEEITPLEGDPDYDEWTKAKGERQTRMGELKQQQQQLDENIQLTAKEMEEFKKENNLDDTQAKEFFDNVNGFLDQIFEGKVDRKILSMFQRAMNADKEVETARKQAEIKAKNEKIEAKKKEEVKKSGDTLPRLKKGQVSQDDKDEKVPSADPFASAFDRERTRQRF